MRELNEIHRYIDEECFQSASEMNAHESAVEVHSNNYLNLNNDKTMALNQASGDSGIIYDPDDKMTSSKISINSCGIRCGASTGHLNKNLNKTRELNDSGIDSIAKLSTNRDFYSKRSLSKNSIKSTSTVAVAMRGGDGPQRTTSKLRSKRYSLPDIDKLKQYNENKQQTSSNTKKSAQQSTSATKSICTSNRKTTCDIKNETQAQAMLPLVPTEAGALANVANNTFTIDPKLINKCDGLSQTLYYIDENGSPKIRERYIKQQRMIVEKQEQKRREREANKDFDGSCSCFNFSKLSKKFKELCKLSNINLTKY